MIIESPCDDESRQSRLIHLIVLAGTREQNVDLTVVEYRYRSTLGFHVDCPRQL